MNIDLSALDVLPETNPVSLADLNDLGLARCAWTCFISCFGRTCGVTEVAD